MAPTLLGPNAAMIDEAANRLVPGFDRNASMMQIVRLCAEYLDLRHRPSEADPARVAGLELLFREPPGPGTTDRRAFARTEVVIPVLVVLAAERLPARTIDIGGGGLRLALHDRVVPPALHWITVVAADDEMGFDYEFRCDLRWRRGFEAGLRFLGAPVRASRSSRPH